MKHGLMGALMVAIAALSVSAPDTAEAKRLGAGKAAGMQRNMPARTAPDAPPAKPAQAAPQSTQAAPAAAPAATPAATPATPPKRNWMGPLAGLAAGLGIAALLSHFGLGGAAASFLTTLLLAGAAALLLMFLWRRFGPGARGHGNTPALAGMGTRGVPAAGGAQVAWPAAQREPTFERVQTPPAAASSGTLPNIGPDALSTTSPAVAPLSAEPIGRAFVPAAFDSEAFARTAKLIFIRLQAAHDAADLDDLRRYTTPELFASIRLDIQERGNTPQSTDVVKVDAEVLDVVNDADRQIVSVRFHGQMVEEKGAAPTAFNEVWHLVKPHDDSSSWTIAGIEPIN